jgi:hypothetical protein
MTALKSRYKIWFELTFQASLTMLSLIIQIMKYQDDSNILQFDP